MTLKLDNYSFDKKTGLNKLNYVPYNWCFVINKIKLLKMYKFIRDSADLSLKSSCPFYVELTVITYLTENVKKKCKNLHFFKRI